MATVGEAREAVAVAEYDLLLVDLGLPDGDGLVLIRDFRRRAVKTPILVLTARSTIDERISGLDAGADDYLGQALQYRRTPGSMPCAAAARAQHPNPVLSVARLTLDVATGVANSSNVDLGLAPRERTVLEILMREAGARRSKTKARTCAFGIRR